MRIAAISDTHGKHNEISINNVDFLFHLGDFSFKPNAYVKKPGMLMRLYAAKLFLEWFGKQSAKYKILVAGNHDNVCEKQEDEFRKLCYEFGVHYLKHELLHISEFNLNIFGTPYSTYDNLPGASAFHLKKELIVDKINKIPVDAKIIMSHNAPLEILDRDIFGEHHGCSFLKERLEIVKPKLHLFGHVHDSFGVRENDETTFVNACLVNNKEEICNEVVYFTIE